LFGAGAAGLLAGVLSGAEWAATEEFYHFYNLDYDFCVAAMEKRLAGGGDVHLLNDTASVYLYRSLFRADAIDVASALDIGAFLRRPRVSMDAGDKKRFEELLSSAEKLSRERLEKNGADSQAMYALGVTLLHRANHLFLVEKEWRQALKISGECRKLHSRALELDPNLVDAMLIPSVHEYVIGSLPIYLKALGFLVGFTGEKNKGINGVRTVAQYGRRSQVEAQVLYALIEHREEHPEKGLDTMRGLATRFPGNHFYRMELVSLLKDAKKKDEARRELQQLQDRRYRHLRPERLEAFRQEFES
jgi:hypothetical protein